MSGEDTLRCWLYLLHWTTTRPFAPRPRTSAPRSPEPPGIRTSVSRSRCRSRATSRSNCGPDIPSVLPTCASSKRWRAARAGRCEAPTDDQDVHHPDGYAQRDKDREPLDDEVTGRSRTIRGRIRR